MDLGYSAILPGQQVAAVSAHQLPDLSELSQQEVLTGQMGHPVASLLGFDSVPRQVQLLSSLGQLGALDRGREEAVEGVPVGAVLGRPLHRSL